MNEEITKSPIESTIDKDLKKLKLGLDTVSLRSEKLAQGIIKWFTAINENEEDANSELLLKSTLLGITQQVATSKTLQLFSEFFNLDKNFLISIEPENTEKQPM